jgi:hypothetical protein
LNLIEGWFSVLTRKALKNASFASVAQLERAIDLRASHWNDNPQPLVWTKPPTTSSPKSSEAEPHSPLLLNRDDH